MPDRPRTLPGRNGWPARAGGSEKAGEEPVSVDSFQEAASWNFASEDVLKIGMGLNG